MDKILSFFKSMDIAEMLPEMGKFMSGLEGFARLAVLAGPLVLLALGLWYYFLPPKEANHKAGFRTYLTMGSVEAWQFAQKLAGMFYMVLGGGMTLVIGIISIFFNAEDALAMANTVFICVIVELVLTLIAWIGVNVLVFRAYDAQGNRRSKR